MKSLPCWQAFCCRVSEEAASGRFFRFAMVNNNAQLPVSLLKRSLLDGKQLTLQINPSSRIRKLPGLFV